MHTEGWQLLGPPLGWTLLGMAAVALPLGAAAARWRGSAALVAPFSAGAVALSVLAGALAWFAPAVFRALTCKEGALEVATLPLLLAGAAAWAVGPAPERGRWFRLLVAAGTLFVLFEELDYLQLVFGYATPDGLRPYLGRSGNLNFHNTWPGTLALLTAVLTLFVALPLSLRHHRWGPRLRAAGVTPPPRPVIAAVLAIVLVVNPLSMLLGVDAGLQEATELALALAALAWAIDRPASDSRAAVAPGQTPPTTP